MLTDMTTDIVRRAVPLLQLGFLFSPPSYTILFMYVLRLLFLFIYFLLVDLRAS